MDRECLLIMRPLIACLSVLTLMAAAMPEGADAVRDEALHNGAQVDDLDSCETLILEPTSAYAFRDCVVAQDKERLNLIRGKLAEFKEAFLNRECQAIYSVLEADMNMIEQVAPLVAAHLLYEGICIKKDQDRALEIWQNIAEFGFLEVQWEAYARLSAHYDSLDDSLEGAKERARFYAKRAWLFAGMAFSTGDAIAFDFPIYGFTNESENIWGLSRGEQFLALVPVLTGPWDLSQSLREVRSKYEILVQPSAEPLIQISKSMRVDTTDPLNMWFSAHYMWQAAEAWVTPLALFEYGKLHFEETYYEPWFFLDINIDGLSNKQEDKEEALHCFGYQYVAESALEGFHPAIAFLRNRMIAEPTEFKDSEDWKKSYGNLLFLAKNHGYVLDIHDQKRLQELNADDSEKDFFLPSDLLHFLKGLKEGCLIK